MSPAQPSPLKPKRRRRLQFSLRTMLLATVVFALLFGWLGEKIRVAWKQQEAVEAILALGGSVRCEYQDKPFRAGTPQNVGAPAQPPGPPGLKWLRTLLGEQFFARVTTAWFPPRVGDEELACLDEMPYLTGLGLSHAAVTKVGLSHVWRHTQLTSLSLRSTCISDSDVPNLESLQQIKSLDLGHTAITDKAVETLIRLPLLEHLTLEGTHVSHNAARPLEKTLPYYGDEWTWAPAPSEKQRQIAVALERHGASVNARRKSDGKQAEYSVLWFQRPVDDHLLGLLEDLGALRSLSLSQTSVTNEQWSRIAGNKVPITDDTQPAKRDPSGDNGLTRLTTLAIGDMPIPDAGMRHIARLANLEVLGLHNTQITDAGLAQLVSLRNLKQLFLEGPLLTDASLAHLKRLPHLEELDLRGAQFTDAALAHVGTLANLERLWLWEAPVTDAGLAHLAKLTNLEDLTVFSPNITDAGLSHLTQLSNLAQLHLDGAQISPAGFEQLKKLPQLEYCRVNSRQVVPDPNEMEEWTVEWAE